MIPHLLRHLPRLHACPTPLGLALVRGIHARQTGGARVDYRMMKPGVR